MAGEIRVILVDDHDVVRTGLKTFLETQPGLVVVGEARDGVQALEIAREVNPDVMVMDISMPGMDGLEATRLLRKFHPQVKVLALTVHADKEYFFEMLASGAVGYVTKEAAVEDLVAAIRAVAEGNVYLPPALARWLLEDYQRLVEKLTDEHSAAASASQASKAVNDLSQREIQVLQLVAKGYTNAEIGDELGISPKTVARHRERITHKLNIHSSAELTLFAIRTGLISID
jgi:DNA-binding NarL/FixJ family response regulator